MSDNRLTEAEVMTFLWGIESGEIVLTPQENPQDVYAGNVSYSASNGWSIVIFNDCNDWDYIDLVETNDGRRLDFDEICERMPMVDGYRPAEEVAWSRYRIPGHMTHRCEKCGRRIWPVKNATWACERCGGPSPLETH